MRRTHSPQGFQYFMKKRFEQRFPKFQFQNPSETYGLVPRVCSQNNKTDYMQNNSAEQILPNLSKKTSNSQSKEKSDDSCILIGNTLKSLERRILKPRISYQPEILPVKRVRTQGKSIRKQPKFNGIYYDDEKFSQDLEFQEKLANLRQYYNHINLSNNLFINSNNCQCKAYISKSNNGQLVKNILKQRWWWSVTENPKEQVIFLWESQRNDDFVGCMPKSEFQVFMEVETIEQISDLPYSKLLPAALKNKLPNLKGKGKQSKLLTQEQCVGILGNIRVMESNSTLKIHNHIENNTHLGSKKNLFINLKQYYSDQKLNVFNFLPLTYHIKNKQDLDIFLVQNLTSNRIWIVKPGELTNRGQGIQIFSSVNQVFQLLKGNHTHRNGANKTFIVQQYITNPLLYNARKFDIRCFILFTSINGQQKGYWYQEGYIRTSSKEFSLNNLNNKMVHLTNDAVQKNSEDYGKYEKGNKISFEEFQKFITVEKFNQVYQNMKQIAFHQFLATAGLLDPLKRENTFELFGLDFMIDQDYRTLLIETNTNPCLEQTGPLLAGFMPQLIDNVFKIVLDPLYPPPIFYTSKKMIYENLNNKFELIYDSQTVKIDRTNVIIDPEL